MATVDVGGLFKSYILIVFYIIHKKLYYKSTSYFAVRLRK